MSNHFLSTALSGEIKVLEGLHLDYQCALTADVQVYHDKGDRWTPPSTEYEVSEITSLEFEYMSYFDSEEKDLTLTEYCLRHGEEYHVILQVVTDIAKEYVEETLHEYVESHPDELTEYESYI